MRSLSPDGLRPHPLSPAQGTYAVLGLAKQRSTGEVQLAVETCGLTEDAWSFGSTCHMQDPGGAAVVYGYSEPYGTVRSPFFAVTWVSRIPRSIPKEAKEQGRGGLTF